MNNVGPMKLIFEPHNGFGGEDPNGDPWPYGYISEGPGRPIFELRPVFFVDHTKMAQAIKQMIGVALANEGECA